MKIGIFGPVFVNVEMQVDGEVDVLGENKGIATLSYTGDSLDIAKDLSKDHDVTLLTSLDTPAQIYIKRVLHSYNINTQYISGETHGLGFLIYLSGTTEGHVFRSTTSLDFEMKQIKLHSNEIFNNLDAMIMCEFNSDLIRLCSKYAVPLYWYTDVECLLFLDNDENRLLSSIKKIFTRKEYNDLLKEVQS